MQVNELFLPTIVASGGGAEECNILLHDYLVDLAKAESPDGLYMVAKLVEASVPTLPSERRVIKQSLNLVQVVLDAAYACPIIGTRQYQDGAAGCCTAAQLCLLW